MKDCGNLLGRDLGKPFLPNKPSTASQLEGLKKVFIENGYTISEEK